jgi:hypothetical protein
MHLNRSAAFQSLVGIPKRILHGIEAPNPFADMKKKFADAEKEANTANAAKQAWQTGQGRMGVDREPLGQNGGSGERSDGRSRG